MPPADPPFLSSVTRNGATLVRVPLTDSGCGSEIRFELDWDALETELTHPQTKLLHWCNPHNPAGRCWSADELERICRLCVANDVTILSDEVWGEMPLADLESDTGEGRVPFVSTLQFLTPPTTATTAAAATATAGTAAATAAVTGKRRVDGASVEAEDAGIPDGIPGLRERLIVLLSPSKCFNVASLDLAVAVVPAPSLRRKFRDVGSDSAEVTPFGYVAAEAAYGHVESEEWRQRLLHYLRANRDFAFDELTRLPGVRATRPEASYLMWLSMPDLGMDAAEFFEKHGVGLSGAVDFGGSRQCCRLNFGCTRQTLQRAVSRIATALETVDRES